MRNFDMESYVKHLKTQIEYWQTLALKEREKNEKLSRQNESLKEQIDFVKQQIEYPARLVHELLMEVTYGVEDDE